MVRWVGRDAVQLQHSGDRKGQHNNSQGARVKAEQVLSTPVCCCCPGGLLGAVAAAPTVVCLADSPAVCCGGQASATG
jgi:hypothetical protein